MSIAIKYISRENNHAHEHEFVTLGPVRVKFDATLGLASRFVDTLHAL